MSRAKPLWAPPPRDGVDASRVAVSAGAWATVLDFLRARMPAVGDWPERLARGAVLGAHGQALTANAACRTGDLIWYWRSPPDEVRIPFEIELLHQDEHLVVVDKPHFLPVAPVGRYLQETVLVRLKRLLGIGTLVPMHRLDRDTAGVLAFVVQPATRHAYHSLLRDRQVHKVYEAVAPWRSDLQLPLDLLNRLQRNPDVFMQMQVVQGVPNAITRVELIKHLGLQRTVDNGMNGLEWAHYRLTPLTGARHQLRAQLCALGMPIAGDTVYPTMTPEREPDQLPNHALPLQLLARELGFVDPISGQRRLFTSRRHLQMTIPSKAVGALQ